MSKKDLKFYIFIGLFFLMIIIGFLTVETRTQKRWDNYEQKVFAEYNIR